VQGVPIEDRDTRMSTASSTKITEQKMNHRHLLENA